MRAVARLIPQPLLGLVSGMCAGVEFTMRIIKSSWAVLLRARNELLLAKLLNFGGLDITARVDHNQSDLAHMHAAEGKVTVLIQICKILILCYPPQRMR